MKKVYVIEADWADEHWIRAICETREQADAMAATPLASDPASTEYSVTEWELDRSRDQTGSEAK